MFIQVFQPLVPAHSFEQSVVQFHVILEGPPFGVKQESDHLS
jgi:hypothetical protein